AVGAGATGCRNRLASGGKGDVAGRRCRARVAARGGKMVAWEGCRLAADGGGEEPGRRGRARAAGGGGKMAARGWRPCAGEGCQRRRSRAGGSLSWAGAQRVLP